MRCELFYLPAIDSADMHTVVVTRVLLTRRNNAENTSEELLVARARGNSEPHARYLSISVSTEARKHPHDQLDDTSRFYDCR